MHKNQEKGASLRIPLPQAYSGRTEQQSSRAHLDALRPEPRRTSRIVTGMAFDEAAIADSAPFPHLLDSRADDDLTQLKWTHKIRDR